MQTLARWLRRLADRLDPPVPVVPEDVPDSPYLSAARLLTEAVEARHGKGFGEAKRHQVYAALIKQFPDASKRALSRAIEDAL